MSTTLLMGRCPAADRRAFSHGGEGPIVTSSNARAVKRGQRAGHSTVPSKTPSPPRAREASSLESADASPETGDAPPFCASARSAPPLPRSSPHGSGASGAPVAACSSRATPYTPRQSGRLGVISSSNTSVEMASTSANGVPGANRSEIEGISDRPASRISSSSTMMPLWSLSISSSSAARIMPLDGTPRSLAALILVPSGIRAPGRATATVCPAATFGAPQTIPADSPCPTSPVHTFSLSASGCGSAVSTRPTTKFSTEGTPWWRIVSTFVPVIVRRSSIAAVSRSGEQYSRSQFSGTFIRPSPSERVQGYVENWGSSKLLQETQIVFVVEAQIRDSVLQHRDPLDPHPPRIPLNLLGVIAGTIGLRGRHVGVNVGIDLACAEHLQPALTLTQRTARAVAHEALA